MSIAAEIALARLQVPSAGALTVRLLDAQVGGENLAVAVDADALPLLAVPLPEGERPWEDSSSQGLAVTTVDGTLFGSQARRALVRCTHSVVEASFIAFAADLTAALVDSDESVTETCEAVMARWRSLLAPAKHPYLGENQVMGLLAELHALEALVATAGPAAALRAWVGPTGTVHDFHGSLGNLEVKATANVEQRSVHINGLHQLDSPQHGSLHLYVEVMTPSAQGDSLPDAIERLLAAGASPVDLLERLDAVGYELGHADYYSRIRFDLDARAVYLVDDSFPRLTPSSLRDREMIENVTRVEYTLSLAGVAPLEGDAAALVAEVTAP